MFLRCLRTVCGLMRDRMRTDAQPVGDRRDAIPLHQVTHQFSLAGGELCLQHLPRRFLAGPLCVHPVGRPFQCAFEEMAADRIGDIHQIRVHLLQAVAHVLEADARPSQPERSLDPAGQLADLEGLDQVGD